MADGKKISQADQDFIKDHEKTLLPSIIAARLNLSITTVNAYRRRLKGVTDKPRKVKGKNWMI